MKKIVLLILVLAGAAGAAFYMTRPSSTPATAEYYAEYLPADTLATVSLLDLKGLTDRFPASGLGKFLAKPTIHSILTELGGDPKTAGQYDQVYDGIAGVLTNPAFRQIFGDDAVVAVLPPDVKRMQDAPEEELRKAMLVFGTSSVSGAVDSFARLVMSKSVTRETIDGLEVTRVQLDENEIVYGYSSEGILILAYDPARISAALRQKKSGTGLRQSAPFTSAADFWNSAADSRQYARAYVDFVEIGRLLAASPEEDAKRFARYFTGFKVAASVVFERGDELHISSQMSYDFDALDPLIKKQYQAVSDDNLSLGLLTPGALAYYWVSLVDSDYIKGLLAATDDEQYKKAAARFQLEMGISLDKAITAVGPQTGLVVNDIVNTGLFPLPRMVLFLQVRDRQAVDKLLTGLRSDIARRGFAAEQSEEVDGSTVYYWSILPGEATQPAIVVMDDMIYVANGRQTLVDMVKKGGELKTLPVAMADILGDSMVANIGASNYTTLVIRPDRLADKMKDAADWLAGMLAATNGVNADRLKDEILKLMHSVDVLTATSRIGKEKALSSLVLKYKKADTAKTK
jgi:hypothetical protein